MLTPQQIKDLESLSYLWKRDGGWLICEYHSRMYSISVRFSNPGGPNVSELKRLRQWLAEFAALPPAQAKARIGSRGIYPVGDFPGLEGHHLIERGRELGLELVVTELSQTFRTPCRSDGTAPLIMDDEEEVEYVIQRMRDAECPVLTVEED